MSQKLVLIDGHSILNRAFYGVPDLSNAEGLHTNAIYGFLNILCKILEEEKPDYLAVAFDVHAPTFRHKMYDGYKAQRKRMPDELAEQMPIIKEVLDAMNGCDLEIVIPNFVFLFAICFKIGFNLLVFEIGGKIKCSFCNKLILSLFL